MDNPTTPLVSILVPNYRTPLLTKLCLRLLRQYTDLNQARIIVVDNDSRDESTEYIRSLPWVNFIERAPISGESPGASHARALDLAMNAVSTPYVLSIHTDTLVYHPDWLNFLLSHIKDNPNIAGVGSWKLEHTSKTKKIFKKIERILQKCWHTLLRKPILDAEGTGNQHYYLRSHCALYRTELFNRYKLRFDDEGQTAGKTAHRILIEKSHEMIFLPAEDLLPYLHHVNHATMVLNEMKGVNRRSKNRATKRWNEIIARHQLKNILNNNALDH